MSMSQGEESNVKKIKAERISVKDPEKVWLLIMIDKGNGGSTKITLRVPLDSNNRNEEDAVKSFGAELPVVYEVNIDFDELSNGFATKLAQIYNDEIIGAKLTSLTREDLLDDEVRKILVPLAIWGARVFYRLFVNFTPKCSEGNIELVRNTLRHALSRPQHISIHISAQYIPWAFLIDGQGIDWTKSKTVPLERFWGLMHNLQVQFPNTNGRIDLKPDPKLLSAVCQNADIERWHQHPTHPFMRLNGAVTNITNVPDLTKALCHFNQDCFYFFGHATRSDEGDSLNLLDIPFIDVMVQDCEKFFASKYPVIVFLNGCYTSPLKKWSAESMLGFLCDAGDYNLCCIGAVASVPNTWAALFAEKLWDAFMFNNATIGEAVRFARLYLWEKHNNPLGLLYTVFGRADTYIRPSLVSHETN